MPNPPTASDQKDEVGRLQPLTFSLEANTTYCLIHIECASMLTLTQA
jgi:hypothetical protein